jgi:hypothetical protein
VLNKLCQFFIFHKSKVPAIGLLLAFGIVGFGVVGQQTKPVLSNQIEKFPSSSALAGDVPRSTNTNLLSRLREVKEQRSQQLAKSTNVRSKLVSSSSLLKNIKTVSTTTKEPGVLPRGNFPKQDGTYLYGQSPQANQPGNGYIVFQKQQGRVMGALYTPDSEFSCFQGTIGNSGDLAMTVTTTPGEGGPIQVSTNSRIPQVSDDESFTYDYSLELGNYHRLNSVSANDRRILRVCNQVSKGSYTKLVQ